MNDSPLLNFPCNRLKQREIIERTSPTRALCDNVCRSHQILIRTTKLLSFLVKSWSHEPAIMALYEGKTTGESFYERHLLQTVPYC